MRHVFNVRYTQMLAALEAAWASDGGAIQPAVRLMMQLREPALALITKPRRPPPGNYGPSFTFKRSDDSDIQFGPPIR